MKSRSSKNKGRRLQIWICEKIAAIFDVPFDNQDDNCLIHSREMGQSKCDIVLRGEIKKIFNFDIEAKNTEVVQLYKFIEQAKKNIEVNREWLMVHKKNNSDPVVVMSWDSFEKLIRKGICR